MQLWKQRDLKYLYLNTNLISDISPLGSMVSLIVLDLRTNEISDLSPLLDCTGLKDLSVMFGNPLDEKSVEVIEELKDRDVTVMR